MFCEEEKKLKLHRKDEKDEDENVSLQYGFNVLMVFSCCLLMFVNVSELEKLLKNTL